MCSRLYFLIGVARGPICSTRKHRPVQKAPFGNKRHCCTPDSLEAFGRGRGKGRSARVSLDIELAEERVTATTVRCFRVSRAARASVRSGRRTIATSSGSASSAKSPTIWRILSVNQSAARDACEEPQPSLTAFTARERRFRNGTRARLTADRPAKPFCASRSAILHLSRQGRRA